MEIKSPVEYFEEPVDQLDIAFVGGEMRYDTLEDTAVLTVGPDLIVVRWPDRTVEIERRNMLWYQLRKTTRRRLIKPPKPSVAEPGTVVAEPPVVA